MGEVALRKEIKDKPSQIFTIYRRARDGKLYGIASVHPVPIPSVDRYLGAVQIWCEMEGGQLTTLNCRVVQPDEEPAGEAVLSLPCPEDEPAPAQPKLEFHEQKLIDVTPQKDD